jgi:hypothetical protein
MYLRCAVNLTPKQWAKWLPMVEFWYNSSYHRSLKCSPFKALYGVEPSMAPMFCPISGDQGPVAATLSDREQFQELLKSNLARAQNSMKMDADSKRGPRQFQLGEQVLLKLQPYVQSCVVHIPCPKLSLKYFGPYTIVEKIGTSAYKLQLPGAPGLPCVPTQAIYSKLCSCVFRVAIYSIVGLA